MTKKMRSWLLIGGNFIAFELHTPFFVFVAHDYRDLIIATSVGSLKVGCLIYVVLRTLSSRVFFFAHDDTICQ